MHFRTRFAVLSFCSLSLFAAALPAETPASGQEIELTVPAGVPLRLYLTSRVPKKLGAPVEAKVLEPVYVFDRQVIPAEAIVRGKVSRLDPVSKSQRTSAILGGDFTPLHVASVEFTTLLMPDGHGVPLHTAANAGLNSLVPSGTRKTQTIGSQQNNGLLSSAKQRVRDTFQEQIALVRSIPDIVRGPDKKELFEDYLVAKLPYHGQTVRKGTRFDAELLEPLSFGSEPVTRESLAMVGSQPSSDNVARVRLITALNSASSMQGAPVEAVLAQPLFSSDHKLLLPEGTQFKGTLVVARKARWFHKGGQLRFSFREIELPAEVARLRAPSPATLDTKAAQDQLKVRTQASLQGAESTGKASLKVDGEGAVQAKDSNTRFLNAAVAILVAHRAADNEPIRNQNHQVVGQDSNVVGRTLGGGFGFGLIGAALAQSSRYVGTAFGYYGMAWSLYSTLIERGSEVQFPRNAMIDIRFNARAEAPTRNTRHSKP